MTRIANKDRKRRLLFWAQDGRCAACNGFMRLRGNGHHPDYATLDHVVSRCRGGAAALGNLLLKCRSCNELKAAYLPSRQDYEALERVSARLLERPIGQALDAANDNLIRQFRAQS